MVLNSAQLWILLLVVPALVSGVVAASVAFLLGRQRQQPVFFAFGGFTLTMGLYGLVDGLISWSEPDLSSVSFVALGFADLFLIATMIHQLGVLTHALVHDQSGKRQSQLSRILHLVPLAAAVVSVVLVGFTLPSWTLTGLMVLGAGFMLVLFATVVFSGLRLFLRRREIHDRVFRRILAGTAVLMLGFVPLWLLDLLGHVGLHSFYWFLLLWNLGALVLATKAFFDPATAAPEATLFTVEGLKACAERYSLTARETEIAGLHAEGFAAKEIASRLFISPKTVRNHISNVYDKTQTGQRRELLDLLRAPRSRPFPQEVL